MGDEKYRVPVEDLDGPRAEELVTEQAEPRVPHDLPGLPLPFGDGATSDGDGD